LLFELPGLDTHGMVLALKQAGPLVSLDVDAAVRHREAAGLATVSAGEEFSVRATVHNPSPDALPAGRVALYAPPGWFQSAESLRVGAIKPWSSREVEFTVRAPAFKALRRLRPLVVKFEAGDRRSTPATELVWW
jgi:hypothetical protein